MLTELIINQSFCSIRIQFTVCVEFWYLVEFHSCAALREKLIDLIIVVEDNQEFLCSILLLFFYFYLKEFRTLYRVSCVLLAEFIHKSSASTRPQRSELRLYKRSGLSHRGDTHWFVGCRFEASSRHLVFFNLFATSGVAPCWSWERMQVSGTSPLASLFRPGGFVHVFYTVCGSK